MQQDEGWLLDMLIAARTVKRFAAGKSWDDFKLDDVLQNAVMHQIQIIGEAARGLTDDFKLAHPELPWTAIIGMRNRLVHHYFKILPERVWQVVEEDIAPLVAFLEPLAPREAPGHNAGEPAHSDGSE